MRSWRGLLRCDLGAADKAGGLIDNQTRRFDIAIDRATGAQFAAFRGGDVAIDGAIHDDGARLDVALDARLFADREPAVRIDFAFDFAVDQQLLLKLDGTLDGDTAR